MTGGGGVNAFKEVVLLASPATSCAFLVQASTTVFPSVSQVLAETNKSLAAYAVRRSSAPSIPSDRKRVQNTRSAN